MTEEENMCKISVPLITSDEIKQIDNYFDDIVNQLTKQFVHDKELAIAQHIIQKQQEEIEKLRNKNQDLLRKLRNRVKEVKKLTKYSLYKTEFATLNKRIEKKDKIIDKMAEYIRVDDIEGNDNIDLCDFLGKSYSDCKHLSIACEDCIKEYFESKV